MAGVQVTPPFPMFADVDGDPLESGYVYIGEGGQDPVAFPIDVFFDADLTIPAVQPIRTVGGYVSNNGAPARIYTADAVYSIRVDNKNGTAIYSATSSSLDSTDYVPEGANNLYFTAARVLATLLTGLSVAVGGPIVSTDSILAAFGKLQKQITDLGDSKITGPASSTDNAIARYDALTGKLLQNSTATLGDAGELAGIASVNGGQLAGLRRKNINGNFGINQRNVAGAVVLAAGAYGHDCHKAGAAGCSYTFATSNNVTTLTITAGSLIQVIEGSSLQSGTHVLSWIGTAQGRIGAGAFSASGVTGAAVGGTNLAIEFSTGTLSLWQLEQGDKPTTYEHRPTSTELGICRKYSRPLPTQSVGQCFTAGSGAVYFPLDEPMRATPTISTVAGYNISTAAGGLTVAPTISVSGIIENVLRIDFSGAAGLVAGNATIMFAPAGTYLSADL